MDSGGLRRTPFSGLQSTLFYFIPADSSGLRRNHHVTICDISGFRSSPLDSGESGGFRRRRWGSVKYCYAKFVVAVVNTQITPGDGDLVIKDGSMSAVLWEINCHGRVNSASTRKGKWTVLCLCRKRLGVTGRLVVDVWPGFLTYTTIFSKSAAPLQCHIDPYGFHCLGDTSSSMIISAGDDLIFRLFFS